jgi:hypothetical protein
MAVRFPGACAAPISAEPWNTSVAAPNCWQFILQLISFIPSLCTSRVGVLRSGRIQVIELEVETVYE